MSIMFASTTRDTPASTSTSTSTSTSSVLTERTLHQLEQAADEHTVDTVLRSVLARRRAVRDARREHAAAQARREHELFMQRTLLRTGLVHLR